MQITERYSFKIISLKAVLLPSLTYHFIHKRIYENALKPDAFERKEGARIKMDYKISFNMSY